MDPWHFLCGSPSLTNGMDLDPDSYKDSAIFVNLQDANKKRFLKKRFLCLFLFEGTFTSFFNDKKYKRSNKTVGILLFLLDDWKIRIRIHTSDLWIWMAQKHMDPDPQHCPSLYKNEYGMARYQVPFRESALWIRTRWINWLSVSGSGGSVP